MPDQRRATRHAIVWLVLAALLPAAAPCRAQAPFNEFGFPPGEKSWGEYIDATTWPWTAVGRVNLPGRRFCSGVLVGPRLALTAAHCLIDPAGRPYKPEDVVFRAAPHQTVDFGHSRATRFILSPGYAARDRTTLGAAADWAMIVLREALSVKPLQVVDLSREELASLSDGGKIAQAGYGWDRPYAMSLFRPCPVQVDPEWPVYRYGCLTAQGYSGAPLLAFREPDNPVVIGIGSRVPRSAEPIIRLGYASPAASFIAAFRKALEDTAQ
jgi:protease YdgD